MTARLSSRGLVAVLVAVLSLLAESAAAQESGEGEAWDIGSDAEPAPAPEARAEPRRLAPSAPAPADSAVDTDASALTDFKLELDPYGRWIDHPTYGTVWVPSESSVGKDFAPYVSNGHWALTDGGEWMWVSGYPFGWVVFHYGRWVWIPDAGWSWVPGREYSHAWVVWRVPSGDYHYVGWAPMPPAYVWYGGVAVTYTYGTYYPWVFCPSHYVFSHHVHHHVVHHHHHVRRIARHTHVYRPPRGKHPTYGPPPRRVARVPANAVPRDRVPANPRAIAAKRKIASKYSSGSTPRGRTLERRSVGPYRAPPRRPRLSSPKTLPSRGVVTREAPARAARPSPRRAVPVPRSRGRTRAIAPARAPSRTIVPARAPSRTIVPAHTPSRTIVPARAPSRTTSPAPYPARAPTRRAPSKSSSSEAPRKSSGSSSAPPVRYVPRYVPSTGARFGPLPSSAPRRATPKPSYLRSSRGRGAVRTRRGGSRR